jgi:hypothetical protein
MFAARNPLILTHRRKMLDNELREVLAGLHQKSEWASR